MDQHNHNRFGVFTYDHPLGGGRVRKVPILDSNNLDYVVKSIRRGEDNYVHLGTSKELLSFLRREISIDLEGAPHHRIESRLSNLWKIDGCLCCNSE
jgi:hypothetical protein